MGRSENISEEISEDMFNKGVELGKQALQMIYKENENLVKQAHEILSHSLTRGGSFRYLDEPSHKRLEYDNGYWIDWKFDTRGNVLKREDSNGKWEKYEYDLNGKETYFENSSGITKGTKAADKHVSQEKPKVVKEGYWHNDPSKPLYKEWDNGNWFKIKYDEQGRQIAGRSSNGAWFDREFDANGKESYYADSKGVVRGKKASEKINDTQKPLNSLSKQTPEPSLKKGINSLIQGAATRIAEKAASTPEKQRPISKNVDFGRGH